MSKKYSKLSCCLNEFLGMSLCVCSFLAVLVFKKLRTIWKQMDINDLPQRLPGSQPLFV